MSIFHDDFFDMMEDMYYIDQIEKEAKKRQKKSKADSKSKNDSSQKKQGFFF